MMHKKLLIGVLAVALVSLSILGPAIAHQQNWSDQSSEPPFVGQAAITMAQAAALAETEYGGKAAKVDIEDRGGHVFFDISIHKRGINRKILIDPRSGDVVNAVTANAAE